MDRQEPREAGVDGRHKARRVKVDGRTVAIATDQATGEEILAAVGKKPCSHVLIEDLKHKESDVVEPQEVVDLRKRGLEGFLTARKELVTIWIGGVAHTITKGDRSVAEILALVNESPAGYELLEERDGPPLPLPPCDPVKIHGCEVFHTQPHTGAAS